MMKETKPDSTIPNSNKIDTKIPSDSITNAAPKKLSSVLQQSSELQSLRTIDATALPKNYNIATDKHDKATVLETNYEVDKTKINNNEQNPENSKIIMPPCCNESRIELKRMNTNNDFNQNTSGRLQHSKVTLSQTSLSTNAKTSSNVSFPSSVSSNYNFTRLMHFNELRNTQNILEKSEQSAFADVSSSSKHFSKQSIHAKHRTFQSSHTMTKPITTEPTQAISLAKLTQFSGSRQTAKSTFTTSNMELNQTSCHYVSSNANIKSTLVKSSILNPMKSQSETQKKKHSMNSSYGSTKIDLSSNPNANANNALNYLPSIQEESFTSSIMSLEIDENATHKDENLPNTMPFSGSHIAVDDASTSTQAAQSLLLALPEFNVNQYSNQTLNLDYNSQQVLKALVHPNLNITTDGNEKRSRAPMHTKGEQTVMSMVNENENGENSNVKEISMPLSTQWNNFPSANYVPSTIISTNSTIDNKAHTVSSSNDGLYIASNLTDTFLATNADAAPLLQPNPSSPTVRQNSGNPLPVAAINVSMINGQPVYTIQLMGQSIPLAAITIPTSDGPLQLQSATTSLASAQFPLKQLEDSNPLAYSEPEEVSVPSPNPSHSHEVPKQKYTCEICGKSYIRSWSYYGHLREHAGGPKEHKCYVCHKIFTTVTGLKQHLHVHTGQKSFLCTICDKPFSSASSLRNHQLTHATEKLFPCTVDGCGKSCGNSTALRIHQRVHQNVKPFKCTQPDCGKSFKTTSELARHEFRHTGEKPFKCDRCEKSFVRNDDLQRHYFIHTGQKRFKCDQCEFSCIQSFDLVKHKYIHGGEKPYKCDMCSKQFTRPARLREHQRLHTGERPYACEECGKTFTQLSSLKTHKLTHGGQKPYQCDICVKTFSTATDLRTHSNSHIGVKPFKCPVCGKDFVSSKTLKRHAIVHTGEKPYECEICKKRFARASDLKVHAPVHDEDKPFKCDQCAKMFTRYSTLKEHVRLHTGLFPFKCIVCEKEFNHRSHYNVHLRTHTGEKPHKCHRCPKEFSRKASLRQHLRTHNIGDVVQQRTEDDNESNFSDNSFVDTGLGDTQQILQLDSANLQLLKSLQNALKRKRDECDDEDEDRSLVRKRQLTGMNMPGYSEEMITNIMRNQGSHLQTGDVTVVNTSELSSVLNSDTPVILTQLPTGQFTQLQHSQIMQSDGTTVVALDLSDLQTSEGQIPSLIQVHGLDNLQEAQSMLEQHSLSHHPIQSNTISAGISIDSLSILRHENTVGISRLGDAVGISRLGDTVGISRLGDTVGISKLGDAGVTQTDQVMVDGLPSMCPSIHEEEES